MWAGGTGGRADSPPPTVFNKQSWRKAIGLQSPSSGSEVIYGSQEEEWKEECDEEREWYEESPEPEPLSPATEKRLHDEFQKDLDECTTDSEFMSGLEGKTLSELDEKIADYQRKTKESRMQAMRRMDGNSLQHVFARWFYESRFTEEIARSRPAKIAKVSPPIKLTPATAAPRPAKVSPPSFWYSASVHLRCGQLCLHCMMC